MNRTWKYTCFVFLLFWLRISATVRDNKLTNEVSQILKVKPGDNITLLCHPALRSSVEFFSKLDFEWITDNEVPIYTNGRLSYTAGKYYGMNKSSLILLKIPSDNTTLTCRINRLNLTYTYILHVDMPKGIKYTQLLSFKTTGNAEKGETLFLPCMQGNFSYTWLLMNSYEKTIEVISLNQRILLQNNTAGYEIADDRSLIIPYFLPSYQIEYECRLSNGAFVTYATPRTSSSERKDVGNNSLFRDTEENIAVELGNNVSLQCPIDDPDFVWVRNDTELLFINAQQVINGNTTNLQIGSDKRSLIITNFSSPLSGIYKCFSHSRSRYVHNVTEKNSINTTIIAEPGTKLILPCPGSNVLSTDYFVWIRNDVDFLFINDRPVAGRRLDRLKISGDGRSLEITEVLSPLKGKYVCRLSSGISYTYNVTMSVNDVSFVKKEKLIVQFRIRGLELPCPPINKNANAWYEWIFSSKYVPISLLYLNGEKFTSSYYNNYYEIRNNSLIILRMEEDQFGVYTCRWSTGEQYVYEVTFPRH